MPLVFAPSGGLNANGTLDLCLSHPPPSRPKVAEAGEVVAIALPALVLSLVLVRLRQHRAVKARMFGLQVVLTVGLWLGFCLAVFDGEFMACQVHGFLWVAHVSVLLPCITLLLLTMLLRARYAATVRTYNRNMMRQEVSGSEASSELPSSSHAKQWCMGIRHLHTVLVGILSPQSRTRTQSREDENLEDLDNVHRSTLPHHSTSNALGTRPPQEAAPEGDDESQVPQQKASDRALGSQHSPKANNNHGALLRRRRDTNHGGMTKLLATMSSVKRTRTVLLWVMMFFIPGFLALLVFYATSVPYHAYGASGRGCYACRVYVELVIILLGLFGAFIVLIARLFYLLRGAKAEDKFYVVRDTVKALIGGGILYAVYFLVNIVPDPSPRPEQFKWVLYAALWVTALYTCIVPLLRIEFLLRWQITDSESIIRKFCGCASAAAGQQQAAHHKVTPSKTLVDAFKDPALLARFEKFAEKWYVVENIRFMEAVLQFKQYFMEKNPTWRANKARRIMEMYLEDESLLLINISQVQRAHVCKRVQEQVLDPSKEGFFGVFDLAFEEVDTMLSSYGGPWSVFWKQDG